MTQRKKWKEEQRKQLRLARLLAVAVTQLNEPQLAADTQVLA
jgi:hypothetical protein